MTRLEAGFRWDESFGRKPFFEGEVEPCINGGALALGAYFGRPTESLARRLLSEQLDDGGWNCDAPKSVRSSFHTTICVLEGLLEYERAVGFAPEIAAARRAGERYLLERGLFRRLSTGEVVSQAFLTFAYPPRYEYDVLRALDYLRDLLASAPDAQLTRPGAYFRVEDSREVVDDGRWLDRSHDERPVFARCRQVGEPAWWNDAAGLARASVVRTIAKGALTLSARIDSTPRYRAAPASPAGRQRRFSALWLARTHARCGGRSGTQTIVCVRSCPVGTSGQGCRQRRGCWCAKP